MFLIASCLLFSFTLSAQTVAVLDTGIELDHPIWQGRLDCEKIESCGHDFTINEPLLLSNSRGDIWSKNIYKYYWIRTRRSFGTWSLAEENWYLAIRRDAKFMKTQAEFSTYNHGTHVSAIALNGPIINPHSDSDLPIPPDYQVKNASSSSSFKLLPIKYLGSDEVWPAPEAPTFDSEIPLREREHGLNSFLINFENWQIERLERAITYAARNKNVRVINGSFGKSFKNTVNQMETWLKKAGLSTTSANEKAAMLLTNLNQKIKPILENHPQILFTFSAGNSNEDVDQMIHFPSGAGANNSLSVGASLWYSERAYFSNYGKKSVDLFAPGLAILSAAVSNHALPINGTSQAAPYVAHLALKLFHPDLSAEIIKKLILATVDQKTDLQNKSSAGGIVNQKRALYARRLLVEEGYSLEKSISLARFQIADQIQKRSLETYQNYSIQVEELPELP